MNITENFVTIVGFIGLVLLIITWTILIVDWDNIIFKYNIIKDRVNEWRKQK